MVGIKGMRRTSIYLNVSLVMSGEIRVVKKDLLSSILHLEGSGLTLTRGWGTASRGLNAVDLVDTAGGVGVSD